MPATRSGSMKQHTLVALTIALCLMSAGAWAADQAPPTAATQPSEPPVKVVGEIKPRTELQMVEGVRGWVVNGTEIPMARVEKLAALYHGPYVLQDLVAEMLLQQEAARKNITVSEDDVQQTVRDLREQLGVRSDPAFESYLRVQNATAQWFHDKARAYALMRKVLADQVYVSDRDVEMAYKRNQELYRRSETVGYRMMAFPSKAGAEAALAEMKKGKGFQEVAKAMAPSPQTGEMQFYEKGQAGIPPELGMALLSAPLNQVAGPVDLMGWFYLIKVEKKMDAHQFTLGEVKDVIRAQMMQQQLEQVKWPEWVQQQLASASIQVMKAP